MKRSKLLLRIAGVCGVLSGIFLMIWLPVMISFVPRFSYTQNWISDLGGMGSQPYGRPVVTTPHTVVMLTVMLAVVGTLNAVFAIGLLHNASTTLYRSAGVSALVASLSTIGFGVFTEDSFGGVPHFLLAVAAYVLLVAAVILIGFSYRKSGSTGLGNFSVAWGVWMLIGVVFYLPFRGAGETIQWMEEMTWIFLMSFLLLQGSVQ
jgi:hypothetical membrane protein